MIVYTLPVGSKAWVILPCMIAEDLPYKRGDVMIHRTTIGGVSVVGREVSSQRYKIHIEYTFIPRFPLHAEEVFHTLKETKKYAKEKKYRIVLIRGKKDMEKLYARIKHEE
jgi:hypothetical protein